MILRSKSKFASVMTRIAADGYFGTLLAVTIVAGYWLINDKLPVGNLYVIR